jgi:membrane protease YdiL (CAAX protease family)
MDELQFELLASIEQWNLAALWLLTALCVTTWIFVIARRARPHSLLHIGDRTEAPWGLLDLWTIMLIWFGAAMLVSAISARAPSDKALSRFAEGACILAATIGGTALLLFRYRRRAARLIIPRNVLVEVGVGLLAFLAFVPPIFWLMGMLTRVVEYHHDTLTQIQQDPSPQNIAAAYFAAALAAPIGEEFFFRLVLQSWLRRLRFPDTQLHGLACVYGDSGTSPSESLPQNASHSWPAILRKFGTLMGAWPIVASAAAFAAMHLGQGPAPIALFVLGLAIGFLFELTGSVLACIVVHACLNTYSLTWETLAALYQASPK